MTGGITYIHVSTNIIRSLVPKNNSPENILTFILFSPEQKVRLKQKKSIPDPKQVMHNFFEAYEYGWNKLNNKAKEELVWFTCSVLLAVQKAWKPFATRTAHHRKYFEVVSGSDEAFGLFLLKNYKSLPTGTKRSSYMDAGTDDATEPELAGDKQDTIEDDDKDDDGGTETAGETDAVDPTSSSKKTRKEKLSGMN